METSKEQKIYLKGYKEGFESALRMAWACGEELLVNVGNDSRDCVRDFINKMKS